MFSTDQVAFNTEIDDQIQKYTAHCYANHSSNTMPTFSCLPKSESEDRREVWEEYTSECAYAKNWYTVTTFTVYNVDIGTKLMCTVRFTAVEDPSVVISEEQFVVISGSNKTQSPHDNGKADSAGDHKGG